MVKKMIAFSSAMALFIFGVAPAHGWDTSGKVFCDTNGNGVIDSADVPLQGVAVTVKQVGGAFTGSTVTDSNGFFFISLLDVPATYEEHLGPGGLPSDAAFIIPPTNSFTYSLDFEGLGSGSRMEHDWLISSATCRQAACWLTGGGVKFEPIVGTRLAERGPKISMGGNVFPSCSSTAGEGGNWNLVDHDLKLHFQGTVITDVACGNVPGIPPGNPSPQVPFNFIEFRGTGTLRGISGNKADFGDVSFFARAEDRNEPGNENALLPGGGALVDRFFIVVKDGTGNVVYLLDVDGNPATVDPVTITGGNLQIHITSCQ